MGLFDIKPLGDVEKYLQLLTLCGLTFVLVLGTSGGLALLQYKSVTLAFGIGFFTACTTAASVGLESARRSKFFTKVVDVAPTDTEIKKLPTKAAEVHLD